MEGEEAENKGLWLVTGKRMCGSVLVWLVSRRGVAHTGSQVANQLASAKRPKNFRSRGRKSKGKGKGKSVRLVCFAIFISQLPDQSPNNTRTARPSLASPLAPDTV
jgi:hypothetical protein